MFPLETVLVTGGEGFIGRHLVSRLQKDGFVVEVWRDDIRQISSLTKSYSLVVHLAGVGIPSQFLSDPAESYSVNVVGTLKVVEYCHRVSARCVIASTSGVYGVTGWVAPISETENLHPTTPYAISKLMAEQVSTSFALEHDVSLIILRLFNVYGIGQGPTFLIPYLVDCLREGNPPRLRTPDSMRDFVFVDDVVEAFCRSVCTPVSGCSVINIGSGTGVTVRKALSLLTEVIEKRPSAVHSQDSDISEESIVDYSVADVRKAARDLDWKPKFTLQEGLTTMVSRLSTKTFLHSRYD